MLLISRFVAVLFGAARTFRRTREHAQRACASWRAWLRTMRTVSNMNEDLDILQHALGLDQYGQGRQYRNHFVACEGDEYYQRCMSMVEAGLMVRHGPSPLYGGSSHYCFVVTDDGKKLVREHSPPPPKLTRSQKRYRAYLDADTSVTFGEWLRAVGGWRRL